VPVELGTGMARKAAVEPWSWARRRGKPTAARTHAVGLVAPVRAAPAGIVSACLPLPPAEPGWVGSSPRRKPLSTHTRSGGAIYYDFRWHDGVLTHLTAPGYARLGRDAVRRALCA
jgi:hypothetical protein